MSSSIRCRTAAEVPRRGRGDSLSEDSEELGGRLARTPAFLGATVSRTGAAGLAFAASFGFDTLPFGLPRGRFTGTSGRHSVPLLCSSFVAGSTEAARASAGGASSGAAS